MNRKPLVWVLVVLGIAVTLLNQLAGVILAAGAWIYLVRMLRKQKSGGNGGHTEPGISEWHLKKVKAR